MTNALKSKDIPRGEGYRFHSRVKQWAKNHLNREARRILNRGVE